MAELYASGKEPVDDLMLDSSGDAAAERTEVVHAQAEQLVAYLQKTEHVPNPTRELIHMESSGALTGLDSALADRLEELAANGQDLDAAALVSELARPDDQLAALRHLAQVTRELPPGPEGRNGVKCLVAAFSQVPDIDLGDHASEIAAAVSSHLGRYELRRQDLAGAFLLGMRTPLGGADELVAQVLERDELVSDSQLARVVTRHMDRLLPEHAQRLGLMIAAAAARGDEGIADQLAALPDEMLSPLLSGVRSALPGVLELSSEEVAAEAEDAGGSAPFPQPAAAGESLGELARLLVEGNREAPAHIALVVLLALNTKEARNASSSLLPKLEPIPPGELANGVLDAVARRTVVDWPNWLQPLAKGVGEDSAARTKLAQLALDLWRKSSAGDTPTPAEARDAALTALARLGGHTGEDLTVAAQQATSVSPQNEPSATGMTLALSTAEAFDHHGLLDFDALCPAASAALQAALPVGLPLQPATSTMVSLIVDWLPAVAIHLDSAGRDALQAALVASPWMPAIENQATRLHIAAVAAQAGDATACPLDTTQIVAHMQSQPDLFAAPASAWLRHVATAAGITEMLVALGSAAPDSIITALTDRAAVDPETAWRIAETLVSSTGERVPQRQIVRALGVTADDPGRVAQMLVDRYEAAGNNQERQAVLDTWRALEISDDSARKQLILNVLLPMAHSSKGGLEAVNKHLDLAKVPPHGTLMRLREDLLKRGKAAGIEGQTRKALEKQGLIEPKKGLGGFFGRR